MNELQMELIRSQIAKNEVEADYIDLKVNLTYAFWIAASIVLALAIFNVDYILERISC